MKKCLIVSTVSRQFTLFERGNIQVLKKLGYEIHCAANFDDATDELKKLGIICHPFDIQRSPYSLKNIKAYRQLKKIINEEDYDLIHCHSPMGGVLTRLAARKKRKNGTKVFYTAHGFHFFKGAPLLNWLAFYPVEKYLSKYTDTLITINQEDYNLAKNKFYASNIEFVNGIGVDENKFDINMSESEKEKLRKELKIDENDFVIIYTAELSKRKNQGMLLKSIKKLVEKGIKIKLLLPGRDSLNGKYQSMAKNLNIDEYVKFLGFRSDIPQLLKISNLSVSTSKQEGLPVNIMESMISGLPIIVTNCRGNIDLIEDGINGYVVKLNDINQLTEKIESIALKEVNLKQTNTDKYTIREISKFMKDIYMRISQKTIAILRTTPIVNDSRTMKEIESLRKNNYNIMAIGWDRDGISQNIEKIVTEYGTVKYIKSNIKCSYAGGIKNILKMLRFQVWLYKVLKKYNKSFDILHCCDLDTGIIGLKIANKYNKKIVYDIFDYYIHSHNLPTCLKPIIEKQEIKVINSADITIICNEWRKEQIKKASPKKLIVIHNSPLMKNKELFFKERASLIKSTSKKLKIVYVGLLQPNRLLEEIAEVIKHHPEIELHIGGFGNLTNSFEKMQKEYSNIFYYGTMKYEDVLQLESECDILFATYNPDIENHKYSAPNKLYEAMALGKPIIVCKGTGIDKFVLEKNIGRTCLYSMESFEECISNIGSEINQMSNIQEIYFTKYDWSCMEKELIKAYGNLY